jgi:hypothetical protein
MDMRTITVSIMTECVTADLELERHPDLWQKRIQELGNNPVLMSAIAPDRIYQAHPGSSIRARAA